MPLLSPIPAVEARPIEDLPARLEESKPMESLAASTGPALPPATKVSIVSGYRPGILARTLQMHLDYYHPREGWGREFEAALSTGLGDFLARLDRPVNQVWSAIVIVPAQKAQSPPVERIVGVVCIDGECSGEEGVARLRWFIVDDSARGLGIGSRLMRAAMEFVTQSGFRECRLSTEGFREAGEIWFEGFGKGFMELKYVWRPPGEKPE
ncbi:hypothetical protein C8A03DRAFT_40301 [Achaetomium macrosporum]|uniref:N-acetyltransferase domain-containing protein n=1 Tax=Achaetomium macrosporum TaxID=79813 RepID=A0AAN7CK92_9PEZI|nr:hypothetical protein C8A03DRAFT_40301 [Achaetomium macrosporum]